VTGVTDSVRDPTLRTWVGDTVDLALHQNGLLSEGDTLDLASSMPYPSNNGLKLLVFQFQRGLDFLAGGKQEATHVDGSWDAAN
jgi:hypothetical protein